MLRLKRLRYRFETAADTLHPEWRTRLSVIGAPSANTYYGHHDWAVDDDNENVWGVLDPRRLSSSASATHVEMSSLMIRK